MQAESSTQDGPILVGHYTGTMWTAVVPMGRMRQWATARLALHPDGTIVQASKQPLTPQGSPVRVNDPRTWCTYAEAAAACREGRANALGFVLTAADGLAVWDLDDKAGDPAVEAWNWQVASVAWRRGDYVERSVSGRGYHVLHRGDAMPSRRRHGVEYYSSGRFVLLTFNGPVREPVHDDGTWASLHRHLFGDGAGSAGDLQETAHTVPDAVVLQRLMQASNGPESERLYHRPMAGDQSQLDAMLVERLCFHTDSNEQVRRLFKASLRGQRAKVQRRGDEYIDRAIRFARGRQAPAQDVVIRLPPPPLPPA